MKIVAIIQARMGSTRFPGKVLKKIGDKEVLKHVYDRVKKSNVKHVMIATSRNREDKKIADFCKQNKIKCYRGPREDVLKRFVEAARSVKADVVVRVCSDCPFIDTEGINQLLIAHRSSGADYTHNFGTYLKGTEAEVINFDILDKLDQKAIIQRHREHVTSYIKETPGYKKEVIPGFNNLFPIHLTLDYPEDLEFLNKLYELIK